MSWLFHTGPYRNLLINTDLSFTAVVANIFKPMIPDLNLYEKQDLHIEKCISKYIPVCTSNLRPLFSILISDASIMTDSESDFSSFLCMFFFY